MTDKRFNFTKTAIITLPIPSKGKRIYFRDRQVKGLALAVFASGTKSFYLTKKIESKTEKIYLGQFPDLSVENARNRARIKLGKIAIGINPNKEIGMIRDEMTFGELFDQYLNRYSKVHKKTWKQDEVDVPRFLGHLFSSKLSNIKREEIQKIHETIFLNNGLYQANRILIRIKAIYNKAIEWGWKGMNPTAGLKKYKEKSRERFVQPYELPHLLRAMSEENNRTASDVFKMLLLTGARKTNMLMMRWEQITWEQNIWRIPESKNGDPVIIPLSMHAMKILKCRALNSESEWVFPKIGNSLCHFTNLQTAWKRTKAMGTLYYWGQDDKLQMIIETMKPLLESGISPVAIINKISKLAKNTGIILPNQLTDIRLHDLRRTFGSYQAISGTSLQIIGKSLGHKSIQSTQIYARLNIDAVRSSVETATNMMFTAK